MIFLTGASGYVGSAVLDRLRQLGRPVRCLALPGESLPDRFAGADVVRGDVTDLGSFEAHGRGVTAIVHAAALMLPNPPARIRSVNVDGTANVLRFARRWGIRRIVYLSAVSAAYAVKNSYGQSKADAEKLIAESGLDSTILRPTMVYGHGGGLHFAKLVSLVRRLPIVPVIGAGDARLQPVYLDDLVWAVERVLDEPRAVGRAYNVSGASVVRFDELLDRICAEAGLRRLKLRLPLWLCRAGARAAALVPGSFVSPESVLGLSQDAALDHGDFSDECGYQPLALEVGLKRALAGM